MIQRIQHFYLLLISIICIGFCFTPLVTFEIENANTVIKHLSARNISIEGQGPTMFVEEYMSIFISLISVASIAFFSIFLFNKRNVQMALGFINYLAIVIFIILFMMKFFENIDVEFFPINAINMLSIFKIIVIFMLPVLNFLAIQGIKSDEELIKSADRIR